MRPILLSLVTLIAASTPAMSAQAAPAAQAVAARYSTANTPISTLLADPAARAIIDSHIPGMTSKRGLSFVKGKSLKQIQGMSSGKITDAQLAAIDADFAKLR